MLTLTSSDHFEYGIAAKDSHAKTARAEEFSEYKSNRKKMPDDLVAQLPLADEILNIVGLQAVNIPGIEADDIAASANKKFVNNGIGTEI
jgi:DNA polymerase-1